MKVGDQKRLSFRMKVEWPVTLDTERGLVEAETRDISAGGAHIRCKEHLQLNEPVHLIIKAPDREPLKLAAKVIWADRIDESNRPRVIGVSFTDLAQEDRKYLEQAALEHFKASLPE